MLQVRSCWITTMVLLPGLFKFDQVILRAQNNVLPWTAGTAMLFRYSFFQTSKMSSYASLSMQSTNSWMVTKPSPLVSINFSCT